VRTRPLRDARQWGYQRVQAGKSLLLLDAAHPGRPPRARWLRLDTGLRIQLRGRTADRQLRRRGLCRGPDPARLAQGLRATGAHSTLTIDDFNSTAVLPTASWAAAFPRSRSTAAPCRPMAAMPAPASCATSPTRIEASHNGYVSRYGLLHQRILILRDDGTELRGEDLLVPQGKKGKRGMVGVALRFHLGPHIELAQARTALALPLALPDGSLWQFRSGREPVTIEDRSGPMGRGARWARASSSSRPTFRAAEKASPGCSRR
jgi:uncharacterized heparinase superfamily protein